MNTRAARLAPFGTVLAAGALHALALAWPAGGQPVWWLQLLSLGLLAGLLQHERGALRGALLGGLFGTAWLVGTFWWLFISMHVYGGLAAPLAGLAVLGLAAFLSLYLAAAAFIFVRLQGACGAAAPLLFAALWLLAELLRASWFTGFPWGASGYAHVDGPMAPLAPWVGVYGIGAVSAWLAASLGQVGARVARRSPAAWAVAAGALAVLGAAHLLQALSDERPATGSFSVALLQGNIPQDEKFQGGTGIPLALRWYGRQLVDAKAALVVAPETAIPMLPQQLPAGYFDALQQAFATPGRAALVGIPLGSFEQGYTNSVIGLQPDRDGYRYDKHHLVPFGEFIPPLFKWFTRMMNIPLGDFNRGAIGQPSFEWRGQRLAPNICYEDLFGEELGARFADPERAPTVFVNVSNIGWFGNTVAIDQHLHISRMRALEFQRSMLRATNTGATVIIDRQGRVTHALPRHTRGVLVGEVTGGTGITPYAWWVARWGLSPLWLLGLAGVAAAVFSARRAPGAPGVPA